MHAKSGAEISANPMRAELPLVFAVVMLLAMARDWVLNGVAPQLVDYLVAPALAVLGGALAAWALGRASRQALAWTETLTIVLGINIVLQAGATMLRLTYHLMGAYPGEFYLALLGGLVLGFGVLTYRLAAGQEWRTALALTTVQISGEWLVIKLLVNPAGFSPLGV